MRSLWLDEALAAEADTLEVLRGDVSCDVCIVGGGFTGLWAAIAIKTLDPSTDVVVVEADICGGGASGRNGGFVLTWAAKFLTLEKLFGTQDARRIVELGEASVAQMGSFCAEHGIDAHYRRDGWLWTASNDAQLGSWLSTTEALERAGLSLFEELPRDEVQHRTGSLRQIGGVFAPNSATVQPARLVRGLRRAAIAKGVRVFEQSPMVRLERASTTEVVTRNGMVRAARVGLAMNAWSGLLRELNRLILVVGSDIVATEPCPELLERLNLRSGVAISDSRLFTNYYRNTLDGRMVFGKGGGSFAFGNDCGTLFGGASRFEKEVTRTLEWFYPEFGSVPKTKSWTGPIDRTMTGLPIFGRLEGPGHVFYAFGYSGNGVGPSHLGGRILASISLGLDDEYARLPLVDYRAERFPGEPFRYVGARVVRSALARREAAEDLGRKPAMLDVALASFMPGGMVPVKAKSSS
ncbi:FAD-dependent oxidoreductase [Pseudaminobacter sp. 19-2017]|uniref:FAD-dependent oxidoreductase n=1 Tax=Pseudaminobacter soli (ex Zhang et al. 2022) TaxID=2831468 RepID=A0A942I8Y4_9HYPH|nr:FAD-dependent oxidoreductase [Pseudaminobacter soli]MBS3649820.1 FAD-dependent oxidoreductase [Pseudaminobacter soli]